MKANQRLIEADSDIKIGQVNGMEEPELLEKMGVTGYPKLFFYRYATSNIIAFKHYFFLLTKFFASSI